MTIPELIYLVSVLNQLVDGGHHTGVTIDEVEDRIERVALFPWLRHRFADHHIDFHLSIYDRAILDEIEWPIRHLGRLSGAGVPQVWHRA